MGEFLKHSNKGDHSVYFSNSGTNTGSLDLKVKKHVSKLF